jgi:hypothetical protein
MQIEDNINVGLMLHLDRTIPDPAFEDFLARKRSSSWADLFPDNDGSVSVPKIWAAFFMGLLMRPDSFDWARKFLLSGAISAFVAPSMDIISIRIPSPPSQDSPAKPQLPPQSETTPKKGSLSQSTRQSEGVPGLGQRLRASKIALVLARKFAHAALKMPLILCILTS